MNVGAEVRTVPRRGLPEACLGEMWFEVRGSTHAMKPHEWGPRPFGMRS